MRYRPVYIAECFQVRVPNGTRVTTKDVREGRVPRGKPYWQVMCKSLGNCGHKHRNPTSAEPCLERISKQFSERRSQLAREAAVKRKQRKLQPSS